LEDEGNALLLVVIPFLFTLFVLPLNQLGLIWVILDWSGLRWYKVY
jgi:hypothetical protein